MESKLRDYSQLEMLKEQVIRCDEELLILFKRRLQTCKKMSEYVKKNQKDPKELDQLSDEMFARATAKAKEMGLKGMTAHDLFAIVDDECKALQEEVFNK